MTNPMRQFLIMLQEIINEGAGSEKYKELTKFLEDNELVGIDLDEIIEKDMISNSVFEKATKEQLQTPLLQLVTVKENDGAFKWAYYQRHNCIDFSEKVEVPPGKYFLITKRGTFPGQLIVAHEVKKANPKLKLQAKFEPSTKHSYVF